MTAETAGEHERMRALLESELRRHPLTRSMPPIHLTALEGDLVVTCGVVEIRLESGSWFRPATTAQAAALAATIADRILWEWRWHEG